MNVVLWVILVVGIGAAAVSIDRRIEKLRAAQAKPAEGAPQAVSGWRAWFFAQKPSDQGRRFRAWSALALVNQPDLQRWLAALPDPAMEALARHVATFCTDVGIDLNWLLYQHLQQQPTVAQEVTNIVTHYVRACYIAVVAHDDVTAFKEYREFEQNPYGKANQAFMQTLFRTLLAQKLTPPTTAGFDASPLPERQVYMVQAIRRAAEQEPTQFRQALLTAVRPPVVPTTPPVNGAPPTPNPTTNGAKAPTAVAA